MIDLIMGIVGQLLYPLFGIIFLFIDILQTIFFGLAGIGPAVVDHTYGEEKHL